jgi:outer membrane protein assembly factor BamD
MRVRHRDTESQKKAMGKEIHFSVSCDSVVKKVLRSHFMRRISIIALLVILLAFTAACTNRKINNPLANVGSKQPDKVLFDRSMDALKHNRFDVARMTLQTLINTYPDSEYIARAKLAVADSWYAEGGTAALQQAEAEYKDFKTFFPNMPEAAEAQYKVANIHYQQMEKPDRDYTHALRAEQEYRAMIQEYPDSKLVPQAKARLREVQEVLAQREFNVGRFYYLRSAYPAAIARLRTLVDRYPLYSGANEALYLLGQSYEGEIDLLRKKPGIPEAKKARMIQEFTKSAADAYARIITRYPAEDRAVDAKSRLQALHQPVPKPTRAAMELSKKEVASRQEPGMFTGMMRNFQKHPDVERATKMGEPQIGDPTPTNATDVIQAATRAAGGSSETGENKVTVETLNGALAPNQPAPRSDAAPANEQPAGGTEGQAAGTESQPSGSAEAQPGSKIETAPASGAGDATNNTPGELKPNVADPNELKPNVPADPNALPPPQQTNEISTDNKSSSTASSSKSGGNPDDLVDISSSKKKKKKGLGKLNPF